MNTLVYVLVVGLLHPSLLPQILPLDNVGRNRSFPPPSHSSTEYRSCEKEEEELQSCRTEKAMHKRGRVQKAVDNLLRNPRNGARDEMDESTLTGQEDTARETATMLCVWGSEAAQAGKFVWRRSCY